MNADDFFEEDEPVEKVKRIFDQGAKLFTSRPAPRGQTRYLDTGTPWMLPSSTVRIAGWHAGSA